MIPRNYTHTLRGLQGQHGHVRYQDTSSECASYMSHILRSSFGSLWILCRFSRSYRKPLYEWNTAIMTRSFLSYYSASDLSIITRTHHERHWIYSFFYEYLKLEVI